MNNKEQAYIERRQAIDNHNTAIDAKKANQALLRRLMTSLPTKQIEQPRYNAVSMAE